MSAVLSFNPLTKDVELLEPSTVSRSIHDWCRKSIMKAVTLKKFNKIDSLPLPTRLKLILGALSLRDFLIEADKLPAGSLLTQIYPATCLLTDTEVTMKLVASDDQINRDDLRFLATFTEENQIFVIEEKTQTLTSIIRKTREQDKIINERFIWLLLDELVQYLIDEKVPPTTHVASDCIHFLQDGQIFIEINTASKTIDTDSSAAVYEAPEVLSQSNPDSRALVWSVGCILYETLALEPAFYDPEGTNLFAVYMNIMNGRMPAEQTNGNEELKSLLNKCLVHNVMNRYHLETIQTLIKEHYNKGEATASNSE